ncbi:MAG: TetR family transcriptional regulator C-terminal domain-containing protein [Proteobacteria bacterium]|nr:TetR family transcriptional regulator C-terminal domain-containing protein [Pseudomonadota bacterium]
MIMPKVVDHEEQRRRIADAAVAAIGESGLDRVRLVDVARAADATTGTLTHYFDGKDALLAAALDRVAERLLEGMERFQGCDLIEMASFALPLGEPERREWRVWLSFWGRAIWSPELAAVHNRYYERLRELLAEDVRRAQSRGEINAAVDPGDAADAVIAAVDGVGVRASLDPEGWPAPKQAELLETLLEPLLAPPTEITPRRKTR